MVSIGGHTLITKYGKLRSYYINTITFDKQHLAEAFTDYAVGIMRNGNAV